MRSSIAAALAAGSVWSRWLRPGWQADPHEGLRADQDRRQGLAEAAAQELNHGIKTSAPYSVEKAVTDWLEQGLDGRSAKTVSTNREVLAPLLPLIGKVPLHELTATQVREALTKLATTRSTRTVAIAHNALVRAIRHAEAADLDR